MNKESEFANKVMATFQPLESEVAERNAIIAKNDSYIYGDRLRTSLNIPAGHDMTPINWLRRTVEIHRSQFMGKGFSFDSSYRAEDINVTDEKEKQRLIIENDKKKEYAEIRREICESINRNIGGEAFWQDAAENASAIGTTVIKAWYDEGEYNIEMVEAVENIYVLWSKNNYRQFDAVAYVYQISKQRAIDLYRVKEDVQTSPIGQPLVDFANLSEEAQASSQEMVTILEVSGKIPGWKSEKGLIDQCKLGKETAMNVIIVGDTIYQVIDDAKKLPKHYIFPNKRARKRPWGIPDITDTAIQINLTFIETISDWRTVASRVNFPKWKAYGFPPGVQIPKPTPRKVEFLPLAEGQDIQALTVGQSASLAESDFARQAEEMRNEFVREVGVSRQLFDMPDAAGNSNPALMTAMKSISDITNSKQKLWKPIIRQIFEDALRVMAEYDDNIKEVISDEDWHIKINFPSSLNADDPTYNSTQLNMFNTGIISIQTALENLGYDKQEIDRIRAEMEDPLLAAIHGHNLAELAMQKIAPPQPAEPKVSINLRGDLTPEQEANLAYQKGINQGPFGTTAGPQGNQGMTAQANEDNKNYIEGANPTGGMAITRNPDGSEATPSGAGTTPPQLINNGTANREGVGIMSQPGSGATPTTAKGKLAQTAQRQGK